MPSFFKTKEAQREILNLYDKKLKELHIQSESFILETTFGKTNIISTGVASNPPIILVHGSNGCAPIALETYANLSKNFRVFAVDVLAQPNKSAANRLSMKDASYGEWMSEIINSLQIDEVTLAGFSFGGLVILKTLEFDESKVKEVFLTAPAYIVNGNPLKALFKVFIPMKRYMKTKKIKYVEKFLSEVFTDKDEFAIEFLSKVFLGFEMDFSPVPIIDQHKAASIKTPINLFAAKNDIIFPGNKLIKRARKIFPSLNEVVLLQDSKHVQNKSQNKMIEGFIMK